VSRFNYFFLMFPPDQMEAMIKFTNGNKLLAKGAKALTKGEMLKFIGVVMLCTRFEFRERASLWLTTVSGKYRPAACFDKTGMVWKRFDNEIWGNLTFSHQPEQRPNYVSLETYWWQRVKGFVDSFNEHRAHQIIPSNRLCVDESMARWYDKGCLLDQPWTASVCGD
jgi:hypothetical protein